MAWDFGAAVEVAVVLGQHVNVVKYVAVKVGDGSGFHKSGVHKRRFVENSWSRLEIKKNTPRMQLIHDEQR